MRRAGCWLLTTVCVLAAQAASAETPGHASVDVGLGRGLLVRAPGDVADLSVRARIQVQGAAQSGTREELETSLFIRRMRLLIQGHALHKAVRYYVQLGMATPDMEPDLLVPVRDAYVEWQQLRDLRVRVGQGKVPSTRERFVSSSSLELVDRSNVNAELNLDRDVGVTALSNDFLGVGERLRYAVGVFGGDGRNRRVERSGLMYAARFEALPLGSFDDLVQADLKRAPRPKIAIGAAFAYNDDTVRPYSTLGLPFSTGTVDYRHASLDVLCKWRGASLFAELASRQATSLETRPDSNTPTDRPPELSRSAWGVVLQASYEVLPRLVAALRYGEVRPLDANVVRDREVGGGASYLLYGHDLKLQLDYFRVARDDATDVAFDRVRLQTQLFF